jgi:hypothetical protein
MTDKPAEHKSDLTRYKIVYRVTLPNGAHTTAENGIELDRTVKQALQDWVGVKPEIEALT